MSLPAQQFCSDHRSGRMVARYRGPVGGVCMLLLLVLLERQGHAQRVVAFDVPRHGGAYRVKVHPDVLTVLYFPGKVQVAYCVQKPAPMEVERHAYSVTVRPRPGTHHGSVNVHSDAFPVGVLLEVVDRPEDAALQVEFRDLDIEREFESRVQLEVERRILPLKAEIEREQGALAQERARLHELVVDTAVQRVADGIRLRHRVVDVDGRTRQAHVLLRVLQVVWLGPDAYVIFSLQNRGPAPYRLGEVTLRVGGMDRIGAVSFPDAERAAQRGIVGIVPPHARHTGVVVLRDAINWVGETISVHAIEDGGAGAGPGMPLSTSFFLQP